jgi:hypothetical protein
MFVKVTDGQLTKYPYTLNELRRENPQISFPPQIPDETLASFDVYPVETVSAPDLDSKTHRHTSTAELVDGKWIQVWQVVEISQDVAEANVRGRRNQLLKDSDWTQVSDAPVDRAAWAVYRQALRDITSQDAFPYGVTWPSQPE